MTDYIETGFLKLVPDTNREMMGRIKGITRPHKAGAGNSSQVYRSKRIIVHAESDTMPHSSPIPQSRERIVDI